MHGGVQRVARRGCSMRRRNTVVQGAQQGAAGCSMRSRVVQEASRASRLQQQRQQPEEQVQDSARGAGGLVPSAALQVRRGQNWDAATCVCSGVEPLRSTRGRAGSERSVSTMNLRAQHECKAFTVCSSILH